MYYLDTAGRVQLLDNSNFTVITSDVGAGAFGRWYEYTLANPIPSDLIDNANAPANGTVGGWFFVVLGFLFDIGSYTDGYRRRHVVVEGRY